MSDTFNDRFGSVAAHYASSRPTYPATLFDWLAAQCSSRDVAWDCGAGSGQASLELTKYFNHVVATDASDAQIAQATAHPRITYRVAPAENSRIQTQSADIVIVAQALHWFDLNQFYAEATRVLKPDGVIAAWSYGMLIVEGDEVNALVQQFYSDDLGAYWPPERRHVENGYRDFAFPFRRISPPPFSMRTHWNLEQLLGYFRSWSATAQFIKTHGVDPVAIVEQRLRTCWGDADRVREIDWPLAMLAGRTTC